MCFDGFGVTSNQGERFHIPIEFTTRCFDARNRMHQSQPYYFNFFGMSVSNTWDTLTDEPARIELNVSCQSIMFHDKLSISFETIKLTTFSHCTYGCNITIPSGQCFTWTGMALAIVRKNTALYDVFVGFETVLIIRVRWNKGNGVGRQRGIKRSQAISRALWFIPLTLYIKLIYIHRMMYYLSIKKWP